MVENTIDNASNLIVIFKFKPSRIHCSKPLTIFLVCGGTSLQLLSSSAQCSGLVDRSVSWCFVLNSKWLPTLAEILENIQIATRHLHLNFIFLRSSQIDTRVRMLPYTHTPTNCHWIRGKVMSGKFIDTVQKSWRYLTDTVRRRREPGSLLAPCKLICYRYPLN